MTLAEWIQRERLTISFAAERIGVARSQVYRWLHGKDMPRPAVVVRIANITGGDVTANDFHKGYRP